MRNSLHTKVWLLRIDAATTKEKHAFFESSIARAYFHGLFSFVLEYDCFTVLHQFLLHYKVNRLYVYIYPPRGASLPPPRGRRGGPRAEPPVVCSRSPLAVCAWRYMSTLLSQSVLTPSLPRCLHVSSLSALSIPALPRGSSVQVFWTPYIKSINSIFWIQEKKRPMSYIFLKWMLSVQTFETLGNVVLHFTEQF